MEKNKTKELCRFCNKPATYSSLCDYHRGYNNGFSKANRKWKKILERLLIGNFPTENFRLAKEFKNV